MYKDIDVPEQVLEKLPDPTGYHVLIAALKTDDKTRGGVYLPDQNKKLEDNASIIGYVLKLGPDAYKGERFVTPWCKEGDFVMYRSYSGTKFEVDGVEFRIINDDTVEATLSDPRGYKRAY
jgi:co-chaperonin GroES (HSP10)